VARLADLPVVVGVAGEAEREVGLDGRVRVARAAAEDRPAAVGVLLAQDVREEPVLAVLVDVAEVVHEHDGVGFGRRVAVELDFQ
jgi:hypothetical protein